jgi:hypothetical protein
LQISRRHAFRCNTCYRQCSRAGIYHSGFLAGELPQPFHRHMESEGLTLCEPHLWELAAMFPIQGRLPVWKAVDARGQAIFGWVSFWIIPPIAALDSLVSLPGFFLRHTGPGKDSAIVLSCSFTRQLPGSPLEWNNPGYIHTREFGDNCHIRCRRSGIHER